MGSTHVARRTGRVAPCSWICLVALVVAFALFASSCAGYDVEALGNSADERLSGIGNGDAITLGELLDLQSCERVAIVGAYTSNQDKEALIGNADVDVSRSDGFTVVVAFEGDQVLRAVRLARVPVDLDWLAPRTLSCVTTIRSDDGRAVLGER